MKTKVKFGHEMRNILENLDRWSKTGERGEKKGASWENMRVGK